MVPTAKHIPIYHQFIDLLIRGFDLLDVNIQIEIRQFVAACQHPDGGFMDRGGKPDLYYSLFGFWLAVALNMEDEVECLKNFIQDKKEVKNPVEQFSLILIRIGSSSGKQSVPNLLKVFLNRDYPLNFSYRFFLFLLVFNARYGKKGWPFLFSRLWLKFYKPMPGAPCSMLAALAVARHEVGLNTKKIQRQMLTYFDSKSGFKAFECIETGDLLSTAVALFALQKTGSDLRIMAPACLDFIRQNYDRGAFLSGNGDKARDLEYTFYGLLALGCLRS